MVMILRPKLVSPRVGCNVFFFVIISGSFDSFDSKKILYRMEEGI